MRSTIAAVLAAWLGTASAASLDLSLYKDKVVLVDFWASWCTPCKASMPWLDAVQKKYAKQGLVVVTVNLDENKDDALAFLRTTPTSLPVIYDPAGDIAKTYTLVAMPTSVLIDRRGTVRFRHNGFLEAKTNDYENHLRDLLRD